MSTIDKKVPGERLFYAHNRLVCQVGLENTRLMRAGSMALAQLQASASLLQTDGANTVLAAHTHGQRTSQAYSSYGFSPVQTILAMIGFTGEWRDKQTGCYPLGKGHRLFSPLLCRLAAPDVLSPFDRGGLNAYAYCAGDPVNYSDPSGQFSVSFSGMAKTFGAMKKTGATALLRKNKAPMSLKPFIRHLGQEPDGVKALLIKSGLNNNPRTVLEVFKIEGSVQIWQPEPGFFGDFVGGEVAQKGLYSFVVPRGGQLPRGVKGYSYRTNRSTSNSPLFANTSPVASSTNPSDNHTPPSDPPPPPPYEPPPPYASLTVPVTAIRQASR